MSTKNPAFIFISNPPTLPVIGEHITYSEDRTIDVDNVTLDGGVLTKAVCLGTDPWMRGRMMFNYIPGQPVLCCGVGRVIRSENEAYKPGDVIYTLDYPFEEYSVFPADAKPIKLQNHTSIPWTAYMGVLGMPGKTAWTGYKAFAKPQKGETIYVTTAAGVVGSVVCQLAKADGLKVIASAGSDEKVEYLRKEIGVDVAFNYKTQDLDAVLKEHGPIDIFWDHVGGETLEKTLNHMNKWGRVIICGFATLWTRTAPPYGIKNTRLILANNLTVSGYTTTDLVAKYGDFDFDAGSKEMFLDGKLKAKELISNKIADGPQFLLDIIKGDNFGKPIISLE